MRGPKRARKRNGRGALLALLVATLFGAAGVDDCLLELVTVGDAGFVPLATWEARQQAYLEYATEELSPGSVMNVIAHMQRDVIDPGYDAPDGAVGANAWDTIFMKLQDLQDTRDFDALYLLNAYLGYGPGSAAGGALGHPLVVPELWDETEQALRSFKMWFPDPTPPTPDCDDPGRDWDNSFFWTENHQILYHTIEFLAGQRFPDECFWVVGMPPPDDPDACIDGFAVPTLTCDAPGEMMGSEHETRARELILRWMDERVRWGFSEWLSNVYFQKDLTPLLTLAEFSEDAEIAQRAAMLLDVLLMDIAAHVYKGIFATTHGRSEMKDHFRGPRDDTWDGVELLFDLQDEWGWTGRGRPDATLLARAASYRMPEVIRRAGQHDGISVAKTRTSVPVDETAALEADPPAPPGTSFASFPEVSQEQADVNFTFWWGIGAWTVWQVVELTLEQATLYNLWDTPLLQPFDPLRALVQISDDPPAFNIVLAENIAQGLAPVAALGTLEEVNTYTYRTPDYQLSTAQDYRAGRNGAEYHAWQATFDANALVFTTHPMNENKAPAQWVDQVEGEPGYWTGTASMPRSGQYENVGVHLYSPEYSENEPLLQILGLFQYQPKTHAFFPQDAFDEVIFDEQDPHWIFGRRGQGYIALYSWRDVAWQDYTAGDYERLSQEYAEVPSESNGPLVFQSSYDLVADGGADNVWIVELGREADWGSFANFVGQFGASSVEVEPSPGPVANVSVFDRVIFRSPSQGTVVFGAELPLRVGVQENGGGEPIEGTGTEVPLAGYPRMSNPWAQVAREQRGYWFHDAASGYGALLDFDTLERQVYAPGGP